MGNSPSKNDPLPNTSNATLTGALALAAGDVEADEPNLSALSRPTGNGSPSAFLQPPPLHQSSEEQSLSPNVNDASIAMLLSSTSALASSSASVVLASVVLASSNPVSIPAPHQPKNTAANRLSTDYTLEIDTAMARLVVTDRSASVSGPSSTSCLAVLSLWKLALSLDSQRSDNLLVSPVFTLCDKDESLVLSMYSFSNLPTALLKASVNVVGASASESSLDPIVEVVSELTPEPLLVKTRSSTSSTSSASTAATSLAQPKLAVRKSVRDTVRESVRKSTIPAGKSSSASSSPLSTSPPVPAVKLDFDIDGVISRLVKAGKSGISGKKKDRKSKDKLPLTPQEIKSILARARAIFMEQPTLLQLAPPVKIVGDIHGQYHDLIRIFNSCGYPPQTNYLFLGDYVDRGYKSLESILLLLCYKIKYPENFFMLRGNHESANITKIYGFYDECKRRLPAITGSHRMWKNFIDVFNTLPIAATINDKIFCIHGGLSPELTSLKQIQQIQRPTDIPDKGLLADLLWSDPDPSVRVFSPHVWPKNDRGVSYCFGKKHVDYFLEKFNMDLIVRGHMVVEDGYQFFNKRKLVTVFLAPNYCGEFNNYGAVMSVDRSLCCSFELIKP
ncbi:hypothetical protein PUMCH_002821 [Australozyma saopauloensis]|uniref:Serine/threonine-protein phosphatase n=1 Tax=Australozyma saopauloensis TaxID=291208 RepID=A0AAX4HAT1_9ASCO|nr:hypothetical protein PUMCH_002821 [[Candida] saopauloensis]